VVPEIQFPVTVDATEYGESTFDNALPATKIAMAPHSNLGNFAPIVPALTSRHCARVAKDREFSWWSQDVAQFRTERDKKLISLNEAERRAERARDEAKRKERAAERKAMGIDLAAAENDDGLQANERAVAKQVAAEEAAKKRPDPLLRETAAILADAITVLTGNAKLAAQVLPPSHQAKVWTR
jgi:carboxyl-terminal processing protease